MKRSNWQITLGVFLVVISALLYFIHFTIFKDIHHIFIYLLGDIAFVPVEVLLVTLIIHRLLRRREKRAMLKKLNMLIGAFYTDAGTSLISYFSNCDKRLDEINRELIISDEWSEIKFLEVSKCLRNYNFEVDIKILNLENLHTFLLEKREFFIRLLENPNLLEHESFTDLLLAVFHLAEELSHRKSLKMLPETDLKHLAGDIKRAYILLVHQWLDYMKHLKENYPYLFSLAMRTNPFDRNASPIVK